MGLDSRLDQAKRLRKPEKEDAKLKRLVAELSLALVDLTSSKHLYRRPLPESDSEDSGYHHLP
jgi:hypothetical protein